MEKVTFKELSEKKLTYEAKYIGNPGYIVFHYAAPFTISVPVNKLNVEWKAPPRGTKKNITECLERFVGINNYDYKGEYHGYINNDSNNISNNNLNNGILLGIFKYYQEQGLYNDDKERQEKAIEKQKSDTSLRFVRDDFENKGTAEEINAIIQKLGSVNEKESPLWYLDKAGWASFEYWTIEYTNNLKKQLGENSTDSEEADIDSVEYIVIDAVERSKKKQVIFTGAPGTGKTFCVKKYVYDRTGEEALNGKHRRFVQFHSSYDYTDFVEGLRPIDENGEMVFVRLDGVFKEFCRKIAVNNKPIDEENAKIKEENKKLQEQNNSEENKSEEVPLIPYPDKYYFIIDEINRADLGKVFGELMYCFEYRGIDNAVKTQYANLPEYTTNEADRVVRVRGENDVFKDGFYIPENLTILCTMNDIDRSVETFDFALRRRFDWVEINADKIMKSSLISILGKEHSELLESVNALNKIIVGKNSLGKDYQIGPAYFKDYNGTTITLKNVWENNIEPILREYLRGRNDCEKFVTDCRKAFLPEDSTSNADDSSDGEGSEDV